MGTVHSRYLWCGTLIKKVQRESLRIPSFHHHLHHHHEDNSSRESVKAKKGLTKLLIYSNVGLCTVIEGHS